MSTRWAGRASRKLSSGISDWPPASTFASSSDPSSAHTSSTVAGAWYSNGGGFNRSSRRRGTARPRRPGTATESSRTGSFGRGPRRAGRPGSRCDDVVREQQRVHDLVVGLGEDLIEAAAELALRFFGLVGADAPDDRVHGMVGAAGVDRDPAHAAFEHPLRERPRRPWVADEVRGLVDARAVGPVLRVVAVVAGADDQDVAVLDL